MSYFRILIISSLALLLKTSIEAEFLIIGKAVSIFRSPEVEGTLCGGESAPRKVKMISLSSAIRVSFWAFYKHSMISNFTQDHWDIWRSWLYHVSAVAIRQMVNQPSSCKTGVMWSNLFVLSIQPAKFCISCSLWMFSLEVPDHTVEQ